MMIEAMDYDVLRRLLAAFEANGVEYAIFGAVAMGVHGLARLTEVLDVLKQRFGLDN